MIRVGTGSHWHNKASAEGDCPSGAYWTHRLTFPVHKIYKNKNYVTSKTLTLWIKIRIPLKKADFSVYRNKIMPSILGNFKSLGL